MESPSLLYFPPQQSKITGTKALMMEHPCNNSNKIAELSASLVVSLLVAVATPQPPLQTPPPHLLLQFRQKDCLPSFRLLLWQFARRLVDAWTPPSLLLLLHSTTISYNLPQEVQSTCSGPSTERYYASAPPPKSGCGCSTTNLWGSHRPLALLPIQTNFSDLSFMSSLLRIHPHCLLSSQRW